VTSESQNTALAGCSMSWEGADQTP